jgi:hypothetical protein
MAAARLGVTNGTILDRRCDIVFMPDVVLGVGEAMRRREFITFVGSIVAAWPLAARAQQPPGKLPTIGFLGTDAAFSRCSTWTAPWVGYGGLAPEPLIEMIAAGKAKDYAKARAIHDRQLPVTRTVYHRGSHMEGTVALKHGLVARGILEHATVRSPLRPLEPGADVEIADALRSAGLVTSRAARAA